MKWDRMSSAGVAQVLALGVILAGCSDAPPPSRRTVELRRELDADEAFRLGRYAAAARRYEAPLAMARARDDQRAVARLLLRQGQALAAVGRCDAALPRLRESAALCATLQKRSPGHEQQLRRARLAVGRCLAERGDVEGARTALAAAARGARGCVAVEILASVGALRARAGAVAAAERAYARAAKMTCRAPGARALLAYNRGRAAMRAGRDADAERHLRRARAGYAAAEDEAGLADVLLALGTLQTKRGQSAQAGGLLRRAGHAAWAAGRARRAAFAFGQAARAFARAGREAEAASCRQLGARALGAPE